MGDVLKRGSRVWKYTMRQIADNAGVPLATAKEHRNRGLFDPECLASVMLYGASHINRRMAGRVQEGE